MSLSERFRASKTLQSDPDFVRASEIYRRSELASIEAEKAFHKVRSEAPSSPSQPFDEQEATQRIARARAHDVVHASGKEAAERKAIDAERAEHTKVYGERVSAVKAHADRLKNAQDAHAAAVVVKDNSNVEAQLLAKAKAEEALPALLAKALASARDLFDQANEIRALANAADLSNSLPPAYLELGLPGVRLDAAAVEALGGRVGGVRAVTAVTLEGR